MLTHRPYPQETVPFNALWVFLLAAFGLAWGLFVLFATIPDRISALFGPIAATNPLFILAVYAPAIAAFALVARFAGMGGLIRFLSRVLIWRCAPGWYVFLLLGIPAIYFAGALMKRDLSQSLPEFPSLSATVAAMAFMLILGPIEEFGWRGLALPLLQRHLTPLMAGIVLGLIWGIWHLPAFFLSGTPQSAWDFTPFLIGSVAVSVILTGLFNSSGGSLLLAALFHFQLNNPLWPDAQPYDMYIFAVVAVLVVRLNRGKMLTQTGVTQVIPR